jgi:hypothetical protein
VVLRIRERLKEAGFSTFLDRAKLAAGQPGQPWLEKEIRDSGSCVVFVGRKMRGWQHREVQLALSRQGKDGYPVIPVILPGVDAASGRLRSPASASDRGQPHVG